MSLPRPRLSTPAPMRFAPPFTVPSQLRPKEATGPRPDLPPIDRVWCSGVSLRRVLRLVILSLPLALLSWGGVPRSEMRIRDPFVLPDPATQTYLIYGTTTAGIFDGNIERKAVLAFRTKDLETWDEPVVVWDVPEDHWGRETVWAPEVHEYQGRYYLFVTLTSTETLPTPPGRPQNVRRGTEILVADSPLGPFQPLGHGPQTPSDWMALDGSLWIEDGVPYMVFCREWAQITDGSFELVRLSEDLSQAVEAPTRLFTASEGPWVRCRGDIGELYQGKRYHAYVSDGNWLHRTRDGTLLMLWSSYGPSKYAVGLARSQSGSVFGPWEQLEEPLWSDDGGHPMLFRTFDGRLVMVIHQPNRRVERARFFEVEDAGDTLRLKGELTRLNTAP